MLSPSKKNRISDTAVSIHFATSIANVPNVECTEWTKCFDFLLSKHTLKVAHSLETWEDEDVDAAEVVVVVVEEAEED